MSTINSSLFEQPGGWHNVNIILIKEISSCPLMLTNDNVNELSYTPSTDSLELMPLSETIKITSSPKKTTSGILYVISATFEINHHSIDIDSYFNDYIFEKVILIGTQKTNTQVVYGSKNFPLTFNYQFINGKKFEDGHKVRVTIKGKIPQKPVFIAN